MNKSTKIYLIACGFLVVLGLILLTFGIDNVAKSEYKSIMALGFVAVAFIAFYGFLVGVREVSRRSGYDCKITHWNKRNKPVTVWVEPYACDYTIMPEDKIEITLIDVGENFVKVISDENNVLYYIDARDFKVYKDGVEIKDGYNREHVVTK